MKHIQSYNLFEAQANNPLNLRKGSKVIYDKKKGVVMDRTDEVVDGEKLVMVQVKFDDGTNSWELADDVKMKSAK